MYSLATSSAEQQGKADVGKPGRGRKVQRTQAAVRAGAHHCADVKQVLDDSHGRVRRLTLVPRLESRADTGHHQPRATK